VGAVGGSDEKDKSDRSLLEVTKHSTKWHTGEKGGRNGGGSLVHKGRQGRVRRR